MPLPDLLADENVDDDLVRCLRTPCGYVVRRVRDFSLLKSGDGAEDDMVLFSLAAKEHLAVLTHNESHFVNLHRASDAHYGILIIENETDTLAQARRIDEALKRAGDLRGLVIRLTRAATTPPKPKGRRARGGKTIWRNP